jgi:hypothetical protein
MSFFPAAARNVDGIQNMNARGIQSARDEALRRLFLRFGLVGLIGLYLHLTIVVYRDFIAPLYTYFNFRWVGYSVENQIFATILTIPMALMLPLVCRSFGDFVKWVLVFTVFVPCLVVPVASGFVREQSGPLINAIIVAAFLALHVSHALVAGGSTIRLPRLAFGTYTAALVAVWVIIFSVFVYFVGFSIVRDPLVDMYDARAEFRTNVVSQNSFLAYAVPFTAKVINPLLIVLGLWRKKSAPVALGVLGSLLIFSANAQKSVFLTVLLIPIIYFVVRKNQRVNAFILTASFVVLAAVSLHSVTVMEIVFRRIIVTPGLLVGMYIDNYTRNGFAYLQHSIFSGWSTNERLVPAREVGLAYWGRTDMAANANFLGDGFANFGVAGLVGFAAVLGIVLGFVDRVTRETDFSIVASASIGVVFALLDTALLTSLLTHGLVAMAILLGMFPLAREKGVVGQGGKPGLT